MCLLTLYFSLNIERFYNYETSKKGIKTYNYGTEGVYNNSILRPILKNYEIINTHSMRIEFETFKRVHLAKLK